MDYKTKKYCDTILKLEVITPLDLIEYNYDEVKMRIIEELNWRDYGGKHYESIWTRFYQGYILPRKFKIDKRKAHYSNLIFSGQITKEQATILLEKSILPISLANDDLEFVIKKFGIDGLLFDKIMRENRIEHIKFKTEKGFRNKYPLLFKIFDKIKNVF